MERLIDDPQNVTGEEQAARLRLVDEIAAVRAREMGSGFRGRAVATEEWLCMMYRAEYQDAVSACADAVLYWKGGMRDVWIDCYLNSKAALAGDFAPFKASMEEYADLYDDSYHTPAGVYPWPDDAGCWWRRLGETDEQRARRERLEAFADQRGRELERT